MDFSTAQTVDTSTCLHAVDLTSQYVTLLYLLSVNTAFTHF